MSTDDLNHYFPEFSQYLDQGDVVEISLNPSGDVFVERFGVGSKWVGTMDRSAAELFIRFCAAQSEQSVMATAPILSCRVPGTAHRIEGLLPPVVAQPMFSIRRHSDRIVPLDEFTADRRVIDLIQESLMARHNIVVAGSTGSGKTTFVNSCLGVLAQQSPDERLLIIEDTPELQPSSANCACLLSSNEVNLERLLVSSLRLSPQRIIVGEVRTGGVLMTLLESWNTGHPGGLTTVHADSAIDTIGRFQMLASKVAISDQSHFIHRAVDLIIYLSRGHSAPVIREVMRVHNSQEKEIIYDIQ
jgi:P-type conjugative transfer ATPase TrbB